MISIERYHDISCGHRVYGHESKCSHLHGHNYRITFTVWSQELDSVGRVVDFSVIKSTLCAWLEEYWDHKMILWIKDPILSLIHDIEPNGVFAATFNPTAENMAKFLVTVLGPSLLENTGLKLIKAKVEETRKCSATYDASI